MTRSSATEPSAEQPLSYVDSSALVKLIVEEAESAALERHLARRPALATSRIASVEVTRACAIASRDTGARRAAEELVASCTLVEVSEELLDAAASLASASVRTLDAIHLASALRIRAGEMVTYDRRLAAAAAERGLATSSPGRR